MSGDHALSFTKRLSRAATYQRLRSQEVLFKQGDVAEAFYFIISGYIQVIVDGTPVGCLGPGEAFGEAGLNLDDPDDDAAGIRTAGITAGFQIGLHGAPTFEEIEAQMKQEKLADGGAANLLKTKSRKKKAKQSKKTGSSSSTTELVVISKTNFKKIVEGTQNKIKEVLASASGSRTADDIELLTDLLRPTSFFDVIGSPVVQKQCCRCLQIKEGAPGDYLFNTGDHGDLFFILVSGQVRGELPNGKTFLLNSGASFGELAVLGSTEEEQSRSCAIVCTQQSLFATLAKADYLRTVGSLPDQAMEILCKRADKRTPLDLNILLTFFSDSEFFKDLHFPYLQMLVAEHITLRGLKYPNSLFKQGDDTDGHLYFLLAGRLQPTIDGQKAEHPYEPVKVFWDANLDGSQNNELEDEDADNMKKRAQPVNENSAILRCSMTIDAMPQDKNSGAALTLSVTDFPADWTGSELYEIFKIYGDIQSIQLEQLEDDQDSHGRPNKVARVSFANGISAQQASKAKIMVDKGGSHKEQLHVQFASEAKDSSKKSLKSHEIRFREMKKNEVIVAHLSKSDYSQFVVGELEEVTRVLMSVPQKRTIKQLSLLATLFEESSILQKVSHSKMLGRNLCRFMGCQHFQAGDRMYRRGLVGDRVFIVLKGAVALRTTILASAATGEKAPVHHLRGAELGLEILTSHEDKRYEMVCTAATDVLLVVIMKEDFNRIVNLEPMQAAIDKLWRLGIQHNVDVTTQDQTTVPEQGQEAAELQQMLLKFEGYRAVYERIVKTIAENHLTKKADRVQALNDDWENDLELYGDPKIQALTHEQYSNSLYQLVDEWCGGVEHTGMYIRMLEMIVENSTVKDKNGDLILVDLKKQTGRYQQLMDARATYQRHQLQILAKTKIGTREVGDAPLNAEDAWGDILKSSHLTHSGALLSAVDHDDDEEDDRNLEYYKQMFDSVDDDKSGELDKEELKFLCQKMGRELNDEELDLAMAEMDDDGGGTVCFAEFAKWYKKLSEGDALLKEVFESVDIDGSGTLDRNELQEVLFQLGRNPSEQELDEAMASMDESGDGEVDFNEFKLWFDEWSAKQELLERQAAFARLTHFDVGKTKTIFDRIDEDGSGELDQDELRELCEQLGREMSETELQKAMLQMDSDGGGTIGFEEFTVWFKALAEGDNMLREVFDAVDMDGGGVLDRDEVGEVMTQLGLEVSDDELDDILRKMDEDGSGEVEFEEFAEWFNLYRAQQKRLEAFQRLTHFDKSKAQEIFDQIDEDGSGALDRNELAQLCQQLGRDMSRLELDAAMEQMDTDGTGAIDFPVFRIWFEELLQGNDLLREVFDAVDLDGGGVLDRDEVREVLIELGIPLSQEKLDEVMKQMDVDGSGEVEFPEFAQWFDTYRKEQTQGPRGRMQTIGKKECSPTAVESAWVSSIAEAANADEMSDEGQNPKVDMQSQQGAPDQPAKATSQADVPAAPGEATSLAATEDTEKLDEQLIAQKQKETKQRNAQIRREKKDAETQEKLKQKQALQDKRREKALVKEKARLEQEMAARRLKQEQRAERLAALQLAQEEDAEIKQCNCSSCQLGEPCAVQRGRLRRAAQKPPRPYPELFAHLETISGFPSMVIYSTIKIQAFWRRLFQHHRTIQIRAGNYFYGLTRDGGNKNRLGINGKQLCTIMHSCNRELTQKECDWAIEWCANQGYMLFEHFRDWSTWLLASDKAVFSAFTTELRHFQIEGGSESDDGFMLSDKAKDSIRRAQQNLAAADVQHGGSSWAKVKLLLRSFTVPIEVLPGAVKRLSLAVGVGPLDADTSQARLLRTEMQELVDTFTFVPDRLKTLGSLDEWWGVKILPQLGQLPRKMSFQQRWAFATPHVIDVLKSISAEVAEEKAAKAQRTRARTRSRTRAKSSAASSLEDDNAKSTPDKTKSPKSPKRARSKAMVTHIKSEEDEEDDNEEQDEKKVDGRNTLKQWPTMAERNLDNSNRMASAASIDESSFSQVEEAEFRTISPDSEYSAAVVGARLSQNELIAKYLRVIEDDGGARSLGGSLALAISQPKTKKVLRKSSGLPMDLRPWSGETPFETTTEVVERHARTQKQRKQASPLMFTTMSSSDFGSVSSRESTAAGFSLHAERKIDPAVQAAFVQRIASPREDGGVPGSTTTAAEACARYDTGRSVSTREGQVRSI